MSSSVSCRATGGVGIEVGVGGFNGIDEVEDASADGSGAFVSGTSGVSAAVVLVLLLGHGLLGGGVSFCIKSALVRSSWLIET